MNIKAFLLAAFMVVLPALCSADEGGLPVIEESVDEIQFVYTPNSDNARVVFWRNGSVLATRLYVPEMVISMENGQFVLIWQDYWTAERRVSTPNLFISFLEEDPTQQGQNGPWWCMFRNMRDLKQP